MTQLFHFKDVRTLCKDFLIGLPLVLHIDSLDHTIECQEFAFGTFLVLGVAYKASLEQSRD